MTQDEQCKMGHNYSGTTSTHQILLQEILQYFRSEKADMYKPRYYFSQTQETLIIYQSLS